MTKRRLSGVAFVWENFGGYHVDRVEAVARHFGAEFRVLGIEIAHSTPTYSWGRPDRSPSFEWTTLFPNRTRAQISRLNRFVALRRALVRSKCRKIFLCHYERPEIFLVALYLRLIGRRVFAMQDSKFDDKQRYLFGLLVKVLFFLPYNGVLVSGERTKSYMRLLGFSKNRIFLGYDTVSIESVRRLAGVPPAPKGLSHEKRHFTIIARLLPVKNISIVLEAYDLYARRVGTYARDLHICGSGELETLLRKEVTDRGLAKVQFHGFVPENEIARMLGTSLALILPSISETWGLVVNEALAMGVPILCSDNVGARDSLVRTGVNGYVFEPDNADGLAYLMARLTLDHGEWKRFATNSLKFAEQADVTRFAEGVAAAINASQENRSPS